MNVGEGEGEGAVKGGKTQWIRNELLMVAEEGTDLKERDRSCQKRLNVDWLKE